VAKTKHGMSRTRIYRIYRGMLDRVLNPNKHNYPRYGGRGICICPEWLDKESGFMNFYRWSMVNGYTDELSIDRKDVNGNYTPGNCRWITNKEQQNNKSNSHFITYKGVTKTARQWSEDIGGSSILVSERIRRGWSEEEAITTPPRNVKGTITYKGKTQSLHRWAIELGISYSALSKRLRNGWSISKALSTPPEEKFSSVRKG